MEKVENDDIFFWKEDGILFSDFKNPTVVTFEIAKNMIDLRHQFSKGENQFWCADYKNFKSFTKEGRDYADIHGQDMLHACAAVVSSHITQFILNTFLALKKPKVPLRAFKNKTDAIAWLNNKKVELMIPAKQH